MMINNITLCADDFAYNHGASQGILQLAEQQRINAISCMSTMPLWPHYARKLQGLSCEIGLHINLTENNRQVPISLYNMQVHLGLINRKKIKVEIYKQFHQFCDHYQRLPDFVDGHQHVQQLPYVRDSVIALHQDYLKDHGSWIRVSANPPLQWSNQPYRFKQFIIYISGYYGLTRRLKRYQIKHNTSFAGVYPLAGQAYQPLFQQFLAATSPGGLIMCHPGIDQNEDDPIALSRQIELDYFSSERFKRDIS